MKNNTSIEINGRLIGDNFPPYIIAEMSANHNGSIDIAKKIISTAKLCGASAVKLQTYHPTTITFDGDGPEFKINEGLWKGKSLHDLYMEAHMPWDWHKPLFDHAHNEDITIFSSPFDNTAIDLLEDLNCPAYKIASFEIVDIPLIKYAASTGKPLIISTGMASFEEMSEAVEGARSSGCTQLAMLHCVSGYPSPPNKYNLRTMNEIRDRFKVEVGLSDHTISNTTAIASIALGASIIEKHFTLDRNGGGPDDSFSLEPQDLKNLCEGALEAYEALGSIKPNNLDVEELSKKLRRSLYFIKDIKAGEKITHDHVKSIRPNNGLMPKFYNDFIGAVVNDDISAGTPTSFHQIK